MSKTNAPRVGEETAFTAATTGTECCPGSVQHLYFSLNPRGRRHKFILIYIYIKTLEDSARSSTAEWREWNWSAPEFVRKAAFFLFFFFSFFYITSLIGHQTTLNITSQQIQRIPLFSHPSLLSWAIYWGQSHTGSRGNLKWSAQKHTLHNRHAPSSPHPAKLGDPPAPAIVLA